MNDFEEDIVTIFYPIFELFLSGNDEYLRKVEQKLESARVGTSAEVYLTKSIFYGSLLGISFAIIGLLFGVAIIEFTSLANKTIFNINVEPWLNELFNMLKTIVILLGGPIILGSLGFYIGFKYNLYLLQYKISKKQREIDLLMPDAVSFMYALSIGGFNQVEIIKAMSEASEAYGELSDEFEAIIQEADYFNDYRTAIKHQIERTPSPKFAQFLSDMLSIIDSGGDMSSFLNDKKEKHLRISKKKQEKRLDTLQIVGQMYMSVSVFPLLFIIVMVVMLLLGNNVNFLLYVTVYIISPALSLGFLLLISTIKKDEVGSGELEKEGETPTDLSMTTDTPVIENYDTSNPIIDKSKKFEKIHRLKIILTNLRAYLKENPSKSLYITAPMTFILLLFVIITGIVPTSFSQFKQQYFWGTVMYFYIPFYINFIPVSIFLRMKRKEEEKIRSNLSDTLRKLSSANETGQTLLESMKTVQKSSTGKLEKEFGRIINRVNYGYRMREALIEFNNKYKIPRLARITKLIADAQEASDDITEVLRTAAQTSENQDDIVRQRKANSQSQIVIIILSFITLLGIVAVLKTQFLAVMGKATSQAATSGSGTPGGGVGFGSQNIDVTALAMLFFHAATIQAFISGIISGYILNTQIMTGLKYSIGLLTITLLVWVVVV